MSPHRVLITHYLCTRFQKTERIYVFITVAIKLEKNKQNPLSALEALLLAQNATKICL
jgi:hypothetical protein